MKKAIIALFCAALLSCVSSGRRVGPGYADIAEKILPVTVRVDVLDIISQKVPKGWDFSYNPFSSSSVNESGEFEFKDEGIGSGVIVRREGNRYFVLTNRHVIGKGKNISVKLYGGEIFKGEITGVDERKDLAVLSFVCDRDLPVADIGDSDTLRQGDDVLAFGAPYGYEFSVTSGIVSALGRRNSSGGNISDFIQTDAAINQGNSGGPLVDLKGEVIGVNTWITTPTGGSIGLGFAIPINNTLKSVDDIIEKGSVCYGWLGAVTGDITEKIKDEFGFASSKGAFIYNVIPGDPACKSGIEPGDLITDVNGKDVGSSEDFVFEIGRLGAYETAVLGFYRNGLEHTTKAELALRKSPEEIAENMSFSYWPGVSVLTFDEELKKELRSNAGLPSHGVIVGAKENRAIFKNLRIGDIIVEMDGAEIRCMKDFYAVLSKVPDVFTIKYIRSGSELRDNIIKREE